MRKLFATFMLIVGVLISGSVANAQTFTLGDHGFGALGDNYGLRIDELGNPGDNTFSVENNGASVQLIYDAVLGTANITGTIYSNNAALPGLFGVEYFISGLTSRLDGGFIAQGDPLLTSEGRVFDLDDDSSVYTFIGQNNKANPAYFALLAFDGHRIQGDNSTGVFRGWINDGQYRDSVNDFLVTVTPVPEPATWLMMIVGFALVGMSVQRRRRLSTT